MCVLSTKRPIEKFGSRIGDWKMNESTKILDNAEVGDDFYQIGAGNG